MKAKELIEILQKLEPDSQIYFTNFFNESEGYQVELIEKVETMYSEGCDGGCHLIIMLSKEADREEN